MSSFRPRRLMLTTIGVGLASLFGLMVSTCAGGTARVRLLISDQLPMRERLAADELKVMLERLFAVDAELASEPDETADAVIAIGRPQTNPHVAAWAGPDWPPLSDQGMVLRRLERPQPTLLVGGGSDTATLWAAYEMAERLGVRYLHYRDVYPAQRPWSELPEWDDVLEPNLRIRCWRLVNDLPFGPISWSLAENHRCLRQLAKMKFNRVRLQMWPQQPFVHYTLRGMPKPKGVLYFGSRLPIDDDTIGREKLGPHAEFTNPDFGGAGTAEELHQRARVWITGILTEAQRLGMETAIACQPAEWPKEFQRVLPASKASYQLGSLTIGPGPDQSMEDPLLREATATHIRAYVTTYPQIDHLIFQMPEFGHWVGHAEEAYRRLVKQYGGRDIESYDTLCASARSRTDLSGGGERAERQLKSDLCSLWFLTSLASEYRLQERPGGGAPIRLIFDSITDELFPLVARAAAPNGQVIGFIDYTASRQLKRKHLLQRIPPPGVEAGLIFTLADDNIGVLPQLATGSLHQLTGLLRQYQWSGYYTRYWTIGDLDPTMHYLARGSWHADLTPRDAYADQVRATCGEASVEPALAAFALLEQITIELDQHGPGFGFPVPDMMMQRYRDGGLSPELKQDQAAYREALQLMEKAHTAARPDGSDYTGYFVHRLRFAVDYLEAADAFGATRRAEEAQNRAQALAQAERAYDRIRSALLTYAEVARDHGDLGSIAAMNAYCYRPIRDKRNELREQVRAASLDDESGK